MAQNISTELVNLKTVTQAQLSEIVGFHNNYYNENRQNNHFLWQYNTFEPNNTIFTLLKEHNKLIATQAMMPIHLKIGNKVYLTGKSENTLILPEYRGGKYMKVLYDYAVACCQDKGIKLVWGFTGATNAFQNFGFKVYQGIQTYELQGPNLWAVINQKLNLSIPLLGKIRATLKAIFHHYKSTKINTANISKPPNYIISSEQLDLNELKAFLYNIHNEYAETISLHYTKKYLNWRTRKHPFLKYKEYQVKRNNNLVAYAFVTSFRETVSISDFISEDIHAASMIMAKIANDYSKTAAKFIIMINSSNILNRSTMKVITEYGFSPYFRSNFVIRDLSHGKLKNIFDITNWNISALWSEGYYM